MLLYGLPYKPMNLNTMYCYIVLIYSLPRTIKPMIVLFA